MASLEDIRQATLNLRKMKDEFQASCNHSFGPTGNLYSKFHDREIFQCNICKCKVLTYKGGVESIWGSYKSHSYLQFPEEE